jgi:hypothetical protein
MTASGLAAAEAVVAGAVVAGAAGVWAQATPPKARTRLMAKRRKKCRIIEILFSDRRNHSGVAIACSKADRPDFSKGLGCTATPAI